MWFYYWVAIIFAQENSDFFSKLDRLEHDSTVLKNTAADLGRLFQYPTEQYPMLSIEQSLLDLDSTMHRIQTQISLLEISFLEQNYEPSNQRD